MGVKCAKTGNLILGEPPDRYIAEIRDVIYKDIKSGKTSSGWEIAKEEFVTPGMASSLPEPKCVDSVTKMVRMTQPKKDKIKKPSHEESYR